MGKALIGCQMLTWMLRPTAGGELVPDGGRHFTDQSIFFARIDLEPRRFVLLLPRPIPF